MLLSKFQPSTAYAYKYRNRLDMNKTGGNVIRLKLTNLQPALNEPADKSQGQGSQ